MLWKPKNLSSLSRRKRGREPEIPALVCSAYPPQLSLTVSPSLWTPDSRNKGFSSLKGVYGLNLTISVIVPFQFFIFLMVPKLISIGRMLRMSSDSRRVHLDCLEYTEVSLRDKCAWRGLLAAWVAHGGSSRAGLSWSKLQAENLARDGGKAVMTSWAHGWPSTEYL